jgi:hypothetical protein
MLDVIAVHLWVGTVLAAATPGRRLEQREQHERRAPAFRDVRSDAQHRGRLLFSDGTTWYLSNECWDCGEDADAEHGDHHSRIGVQARYSTVRLGVQIERREQRRLSSVGYRRLDQRQR